MTDHPSIYEAPRIDERVTIDAPLVLTVGSGNQDGQQ